MTSDTRERQVAKLAAGVAVAVGCALAGWMILKALDEHPPPPAVTLAILTAGGLEIVLGVGLYVRARAAWAFAVSLTGVLAIAGILGLPAIVRAGIPAPIAALALGAVLLLLVLLVIAREAFTP